ncbi:hypothetical protein A9174_10505 [Mesorhizobium loti NZP2037]|nr:hypothetical protein A9174_10505 [Mesorhizobium loti NZP2037]
MSIFDDLQEIWDMYVAAYRSGDAAGCAAVFTDDAGRASSTRPGGDRGVAQHLGSTFRPQ